MNHDVPDDAQRVSALLEELAAADALHKKAVRNTATLKIVVDDLTTRLHTAMAKIGITSVSIDGAGARIVGKTGYHAEDWEAIRQYVFNTGNWQIIKKALSTTALREIENAGELPPGVRRAEWSEVDFKSTPL